MYQSHAQKNTLQGQSVSISELYTADTLEVSYTSSAPHTAITLDKLLEIFGESGWHEDVFACVAIHDENRADIEMMNTEGKCYVVKLSCYVRSLVLRKWLAYAAEIEHEYSLIIRPILNFVKPPTSNVDDDVQAITSMLAACSTAADPMPQGPGKFHSKFCVFEIKVNRSKFKLILRKIVRHVLSQKHHCSIAGISVSLKIHGDFT